MNIDSWIHNTKQEETGGTRVEETKLSAITRAHTDRNRERVRERERILVWAGKCQYGLHR
jgi:hypothetical protein